MAIFHYTVKIVGRSKGKSIISASAYLNGDVMKNEETGRISYYTSKKEVDHLAASALFFGVFNDIRELRRPRAGPA